MSKIIIIGTCGQCPNFRPEGYPMGYGNTDRPMCTQNPEHVYKSNWHTDIPDSCPLTSVRYSQKENEMEEPQAKIQPVLEAEQFELEISQGHSNYELENKAMQDKLEYGLGFFKTQTEAYLWAAGVPMEIVYNVFNNLNEHGCIVAGMDEDGRFTP